MLQSVQTVYHFTVFCFSDLSLFMDFHMSVKVKVTQSCPTLCDPMEFSRNTLGQNTGVGWPFPSPGDLPNPGFEPRSPALQVDSSLAEPQGTPKQTGVGSLTLLQWIFLTQEWNWGLLHCRQILYQLNYEGSPSYGWYCCKSADQWMNILAEFLLLGGMTLIMLFYIIFWT